MNLTDSEIKKYAWQYTTGESDLIHELTETAEKELEHTDMLSGRVVGRFLAMLVKISKAERVLEIGTFAGYSALMIAEALPDSGELVTCEYNKRYEDLARSFFGRSRHGSKINLVMGNALETIPKMSGFFDLVFLDADKINYPDYYELVIPMIRQGGLLIVDNTFWSGSVLQPDDEKAKAIHQLNKMIKSDSGVEQVMLTVRDGLMLVRKKDS